MDIQKRRFIMGIGSCGYGGWEVPQSAVCKLENQESWWCNSVQVQTPNDQELRCLRAGENGCPSSRRDSANLLFLSFSVLLELSMLWMMPCKGGASSLNLLIQMLVSSIYTLTDASRNNVLLAVWASLSPVKLTHKINHHRDSGTDQQMVVWLRSSGVSARKAAVPGREWGKTDVNSSSPRGGTQQKNALELIGCSVDSRK